MNGRVLLIDDDFNVISALKRQLKTGFDIVAAFSGAEALGLVETALGQGAPFAVAVCDMHMPGMNGIDTLRQLCDRSPLTVPIMLTGDADQHTAMEAINRGHIFRFFIKPFDSALLAAGISAGLRQHALLVAEQRLAENEERWRLALEAVGDGVWDWTPRTGGVVYSQGWRRMLGLPAEGDGLPFGEWRSHVHPDDAANVDAHFSRLLKAEDPVLNCEHRLCMADGSYRWFLARGTVLYRGQTGEALRVIGTHTDITRRREMEETLRLQSEKLALLATTDALTGLWNRRHFLDVAEEQLLLARRYGRPLSALMIDIDHFKRVNDSHGHAAGDTVLRCFSDILRGNLRESDLLGRLGGEEFALLLPESDGGKAVVVAELLRHEVAATEITLTDGTALRITASFGVSEAFIDGDTVAELLSRADDALYLAKESGRNKVSCAWDDVICRIK